MIVWFSQSIIRNFLIRPWLLNMQCGPCESPHNSTHLFASDVRLGGSGKDSSRPGSLNLAGNRIQFDQANFCLVCKIPRRVPKHRDNSRNFLKTRMHELREQGTHPAFPFHQRVRLQRESH